MWTNGVWGWGLLTEHGALFVLHVAQLSMDLAAQGPAEHFTQIAANKAVVWFMGLGFCNFVLSWLDA